VYAACPELLPEVVEAGPPESNRDVLSLKSDTLTTTLPSHPVLIADICKKITETAKNNDENNCNKCADSALADHCARFQIIYLLTYMIVNIKENSEKLKGIICWSGIDHF